MNKTSSNRNNCSDELSIYNGKESILVSGSLRNDVAFVRDVPEVLASDCGADQQVPHYYITLPALGPLWCS